MHRTKQHPYPPTIQAVFAAVLVFAVSVVFFAAAPAAAQEQSSPPPLPDASGTIPPAWKNMARNITPFSIDVTILMRRDQAMKRFSHIYIEFPDTKHIYQHAEFNEPFPFEYISFAAGQDAVVHDLKTDSFALVPSKIVPVSIFSLESSAASFFKIVRFEDIEPEIFEDQETYVLKISLAPMEISPGVKLSGITGHMWIDAKRGWPMKMVLVGRAGIIEEEKSQTSLLVDFHYGQMALNSEGWKKVDEAMDDFRAERSDAGEATMRKIEMIMAERFSSFQSAR